MGRIKESANTETTVTEISGALRHIVEEITKITINNVDICLEPMEENSNSFEAAARRIKIHKSKIIQDICNEHKSEYIEVLDPDNLQLRPLIAGPHI